MLRCLRIGLVTAALLLLMTSATSDAAQVTVTQVDRKADGTVTYHFSVKVGQSETLLSTNTKTRNGTIQPCADAFISQPHRLN